MKQIILEEKIIRERKGKLFVAIDSVVYPVFGKMMQNVFWVECDKEGNVADGDEDGQIDNHMIICRVPDGKESLDISSLKEDCLTKN